MALARKEDAETAEKLPPSEYLKNFLKGLISRQTHRYFRILDLMQTFE